MKLSQALQAIFLALLLMSAAGTSFLILFEANFSEKIYPRITLASNDIGALSPKNAQKTIENQINVWGDAKIQISYSNLDDPSNSKKWQIAPKELGITPSAPKNILYAYNIGRTGNVFASQWQKIVLIAQGKNLVFSYDFDENKFNSYVENNFSFLEKSGKDASLTFISGLLKEIPAQNGYAIDKEDLKQKIIANIQNLKNDPISIKMRVSFPVITNEKIKKAEEQANNFVDGKISLLFENKSWIIEKELIKSSLKFTPVPNPADKSEMILGLEINPDLIIDYLEKIQIEINRKPADAIFNAEDNKIVIASGGESGIAVSVEKSVKKITEEMLKGAANNVKNIEIKLVVEETEPTIGKKTLEDMKISSLLGQGKSNFSGSPKNRRQNIAVGAAKFNNIFIADGEEFSFVKILGEITAKNGYLPELVIKDNSVVAELGGGLCQVSTTAFRAAIYAGLPIIERRAHAYAVPYYAPQGMDATIYPPHPDLRFKNDTGGHILIQTKVVKDELIFNFFGTKQSRIIKVAGPNVYDKQVDESMKAVFWREFYENDALLKKEPFYSSYASPNKYPHKNPLE